MQWHLAQVNIGTLRAPTDSPVVAEFMDALDEINALAESSPGFIWRMQDDSGNATSIRGPWRSDILANMSVWETVEDLERFVYETAHGPYVKRRKEWFKPLGGRFMALWWIPAGTQPTLAEAKDRLDVLSEKGVTAEAFTMRKSFPPPNG